MRLLHFSMILGLSATLAMTGCKKDDPCDDVTCLNGGTCSDGTCSCQSGYEGSTCGTEVRAKFLSTYNVNETCPSGNFSYQSTITTSSTGINRVIINNFAGFGVSATASVTGSSITIGTQQVDIQGNAATISGSGQLSGSILTISYTISAGGSSESCTLTCTKQ